MKVKAFLLGVLITLMIALNGILASLLGQTVSLLVLHSVGLLTATLLCFVTKQTWSPLRGIPFYFFTSGIVGTALVYMNNYTFGTIGVTLTITLGLIGQFVSSIIVEHFGWFDMKQSRFTKEKIIGIVLILIGVYFITLF